MTETKIERLRVFYNVYFVFFKKTPSRQFYRKNTEAKLVKIIVKMLLTTQSSHPERCSVMEQGLRE